MRRGFRGFGKASKPRRIAGVMNRTEEEYSQQLEVRRATGEIASWWYEKVTLKLAADMRYTPDFMVMFADGSIEFHEVKGALVRDDALVKLKAAADAYPFRFWMMQKLAKKAGWKRVEIATDSWLAA